MGGGGSDPILGIAWGIGTRVGCSKKANPGAEPVEKWVSEPLQGVQKEVIAAQAKKVTT